MKSFKLIKKVLPYFKRYQAILYLDLFCAGLTTLSEMVLPLILRFITNTGMTDLESLSVGIIVKLALLYLVVKTVEVIAGFYMTSIGHIMGAKIETDMRHDVYAHLQGLSYRYYNETKVGQIMSRLTNDLFDITEFAHHCPEEYFIGGLKILISFIILAKINLPLTLILYSLIPLMIIGASSYNHKMRQAQKDQRVHVGDLNSTIEDSLLGIRVVKSFGNEEEELEKFQGENVKFLGIKRQFYKSMAGFNTVTKIFDGLMYLVVILGGGIFMIKGRIQPGDLIAYVMYVTTLLTTVRRIVEFTEQFQKGMTGIERFSEIMSEVSEIKDPENPKDFDQVRGDIVFDHVDFSYNDHERVLKDFNLSIQAGENIAIVGPSGSGKTTLCSLIPRFYDVDRGSISIDGIDIRQVKLADLRSHIGIVQQDVYLFSGTVYENILYGKMDASREEVIQASKLAGAHDFIQDLPQGYDTYVGERGLMLSGGQKQRISIARVFLKNPSILILDEATSALDNKSEIIIQDSLEKLSQNRTTLTIAHRLTTIQNADRILVMTQEGIIEEGNHEDLMALGGEYYKLYTKNGRNMESIGQ
ncbi:ABC transporter ATP-binding protein [Urinicoccus timonensis]|uniref:ABC transporter ATP-binding protein n=1 Tax=Urinicoccus timonensis TaxID=2024205 RepID=UPI000C075A3D|nr:ABC transporter ATP-binding protein [Urinicoccus timonensis]